MSSAVSPRREWMNRSIRSIYLVFAEAPDRPIGVGGIWTGEGRDQHDIAVQFLREKTTLAGTVFGAGGRPVAGATVAQWAIDGRPVPGILSATTGPDGRFLINRIPLYDWMRAGSPDRRGLTFTVMHPGYRADRTHGFRVSEERHDHTAGRLSRDGHGDGSNQRPTCRRRIGDR